MAAVELRGWCRGAYLLAVFAALTACGDGKKPQGPAGPAVAVAHPIQKEIVESDEYTGRLAAVDSVEVRARVGGYLDKVAFKAGQTVAKNDLLFVIDPRPFKLAVDQAEAQLAGAQVRVAVARRDLERARALLAGKNLSEQTFDARLQTLQTAEADVKAAQAALETARLNFAFTEVRAPVAGRVSRELVTVGNLVTGGTAGSTLLTTIVSLDPIYFYFDADEASYLRYQRMALEGSRPSSREVPNPVTLGLLDEDGYPHQGHMDFVDNQFDPGTGTMRARAVFPNPDGTLTPGQFARLRLPGSGRYRATLIPDEAIGADQAQRVVYVVGDDNKAVARTVKLGPVVDGLRVVRSGLDIKDWIIVKGVQRVRAGAMVNPQRETQNAESPPAP
jgi:RND family efflux transporter MFP subunit